MSGLLGSVANLALQLVKFTGHPRTLYSIGAGVKFAAYITITEEHADDLTITRHPVEQGAAISDHAFKEPATLSLELGWSASGKVLSAISGDDYTARVYAQLLKLQASRQLITVQTAKRKYTNMLFRSLSTTTDAATENSLLLRATLQELIIVQAQTTAVPPSANMANPAQNGATTSAGSKQLGPAPNVNQSALSKIVGK